MILKSMTAFVLQQSKIGMEVQSISHQNQNRADRFEKIVRRAKFIIQILELWMFVPAKLVNDEWIVLEEPKRERFLTESMLCRTDDYTKAIKEYQEAKYRVLFEGFELLEMSRNFNIIANTEKDCQVFASKFKEKFYKCKEFTTIEDLIKYELVLTATAQKLIGL